MELIISGRNHLQVDEATKAYVEEKMLKLDAEYPKLTTCRVVIGQERGLCLVEAHLNGKHVSLDAEGKSPQLAVSVDMAADKLEKQLRKHLQRLQDRRHNHKGLPAEEEPAE